jgi:hypothetical protein
MTHLADNGADRACGRQWEENFCTLADWYGKALTPHQIGRSDGGAIWHRRHNFFLLPDVTIWSAPGEHHEIKHKNPTRTGWYGLEDYRLHALCRFAVETRQPVLYTIHDWQHAGASGRDEKTENRIEDWVTAPVLRLALSPERIRRRMPTWVAGRATEVPGSYWPVELWVPLAELWNSV